MKRGGKAPERSLQICPISSCPFWKVEQRRHLIKTARCRAVLLPFRRVRIVSVAVSFTDLTVRTMYSKFGLLILSDYPPSTYGFTLCFVGRGDSSVSFATNSPLAVVRYYMLISHNGLSFSGFAGFVVLQTRRPSARNMLSQENGASELASFFSPICLSAGRAFFMGFKPWVDK